MNEEDLILSLKNGSEYAFDTIYRMYSTRLYNYSIQYTKSKEDSEELVQDVFTKVWLYRKSIKQTETLAPFIFKIARNKLINRYRAQLNSFSYESYVDYCNEKSLSVANTQHLVEYKDFCEILADVMDKLPQTQKDVIENCKLRGLSNNEVADILNLKEQTIKNQLSLGLKTLKEELNKYLLGLNLLLIVKLTMFLVPNYNLNVIINMMSPII